MIEIVKRLAKGSALTYEEMDGNFDRITTELNARPTLADSSISIINAVLNIRDNVVMEGDTLSKLYNLILKLELDKLNISSISNDLITVDPTKVLSALQGKILKDTLTTEINNRINSIFNETVRASNIENTLRADLNNEVLNRNLEDNAINTRINNLLNNIDSTALNSLSELVIAFQSADSNLTNALNNLSTNATIDLTTEKNRALLAESVLQTEIVNENILRSAALLSEEQSRIAEDALKINTTDIIDSLNSISVVNPLSANQGRVLNENLNSLITSVNDSINADIANLSNTVTQEILDRTNADNQEILNRDNAITAAISIEIDIRNLAISSESEIINNNLTNETNSRISADNILNTRIDNILNNTDETALNSLNEIVIAFQANDNNLLDTINSLSTNSTSALSQEIIDRNIADNLEITNRNIAIAQAISLLESRLYSI